LYEGGAWAYDCIYRETVLLFAVILALLGDNPMQSELACHIGLRGKYFCRCCWVKGPDAMDQDETDALDDNQSRVGTPAPQQGGRILESLPAMTARVRRFMQVRVTVQKLALWVYRSDTRNFLISPIYHFATEQKPSQ
jgi:hypothetical protein